MRPQRFAAFSSFSPRRVYFGWWVSVAGAFNMVFSAGPTFQAASVLFKALEDEFGWSRTLISGVATFGRLGTTLFGPLEGWLVDTFGSGKMVLIGFTLGGAGLIFFSQITGPVQCYLAFLLLSLGFSSGGFVPSLTAANAWMIRRRALGMSIVEGWGERWRAVGSIDRLGDQPIRMADYGHGDGNRSDSRRAAHRLGRWQATYAGAIGIAGSASKRRKASAG